VININRVQPITQEQADELYRRLPKPSKYIFALGLETGLRISDILRLKNRDIENPLRVYVSRTRTVAPHRLPAWLYDTLLERSELRSPDHFMFGCRSRSRKHMHRTTYHRHLKRVVSEMGFDCSAHSTRKFFLQLTELPPDRGES
jgi:integrase